jgi:hypothetical protein
MHETSPIHAAFDSRGDDLMTISQDRSEDYAVRASEQAEPHRCGWPLLDSWLDTLSDLASGEIILARGYIGEDAALWSCCS